MSRRLSSVVCSRLLAESVPSGAIQVVLHVAGSGAVGGEEFWSVGWPRGCQCEDGKRHVHVSSPVLPSPVSRHAISARSRLVFPAAKEGRKFTDVGSIDTAIPSTARLSTPNRPFPHSPKGPSHLYSLPGNPLFTPIPPPLDAEGAVIAAAAPAPFTAAPFSDSNSLAFKGFMRPPIH